MRQHNDYWDYKSVSLSAALGGRADHFRSATLAEAALVL